MTCPCAEVRLTLPYPPSANAYWRAAPKRGLVPSREATAYKAAVSRAAALAQVRPLYGPVRVTLTVYRPRRVGDLDNTLKVLNDALNGLAWLDDEQVVRIVAERADDPDAPRVEVVATAQRHATEAEAAAHRQARAEANRKRRETLRRNRAASASEAARPLPDSAPAAFRAMAPPQRPPESIPAASPRRARKSPADVRALATPATYHPKEKKP